MAGWLFFAGSIVGLALTLNALRPLRRPAWLLLPSTFGSWLTADLAAFHIAWQAVAVVLFAVFGAFGVAVGWIALAVTLLSWAGLVWLAWRARGARAAVRAGLAGVDVDWPAPAVPTSQLFTLRPTRRSVEKSADLVYATVDGAALELDVLRLRDAGSDRRPAVLQLHGGAWQFGDKRNQAQPLLYHLAANGWVCFNANYRLSPGVRFPANLCDVKRAIGWIRANADEFAVDGSFVAVTGESAGGHLAALAALTPNDPAYQPDGVADTRLQAAAVSYGLFDLTNRLGVHHPYFVEHMVGEVLMGECLADAPQAFAAASPMDRVRVDAPPFLVVHGQLDTLAPAAEARLFVDRLRAVSRSPVAYIELPGGQHNFDLFPCARANRSAEAVERFFASTYRRHTERRSEVDRTGGTHDS